MEFCNFMNYLHFKRFISDNENFILDRIWSLSSLKAALLGQIKFDIIFVRFFKYRINQNVKFQFLLAPQSKSDLGILGSAGHFQPIVCLCPA